MKTLQAVSTCREWIKHLSRTVAQIVLRNINATYRVKGVFDEATAGPKTVHQILESISGRIYEFFRLTHHVYCAKEAQRPIVLPSEKADNWNVGPTQVTQWAALWKPRRSLRVLPACQSQGPIRMSEGCKLTAVLSQRFVSPPVEERLSAWRSCCDRRCGGHLTGI